MRQAKYNSGTRKIEKLSKIAKTKPRAARIVLNNTGSLTTRILNIFWKGGGYTHLFWGNLYDILFERYKIRHLETEIFTGD